MAGKTSHACNGQTREDINEECRSTEAQGTPYMESQHEKAIPITNGGGVATKLKINQRLRRVE
jgi:hypothetical protein